MATESICWPAKPAPKIALAEVLRLFMAQQKEEVEAFDVTGRHVYVRGWDRGGVPASLQITRWMVFELFTEIPSIFFAVFEVTMPW